MIGKQASRLELTAPYDVDTALLEGVELMGLMGLEPVVTICKRLARAFEAPRE
jgi:hypothetical protein